MVQQPNTDDLLNQPVDNEPAPSAKEPPMDAVTATMTIMDYALRYGAVAGGVLAVIVIGTIVVKKWKSKK